MQNLNSQITAQWEWKSNPNPYSQSEKAQWTPYQPLDNYLLEKAYYDKQEGVDLGDYIVSIKDMLQKKKDNAYRQRPIRRNTEYLKNKEEKKLDQEEDIRAKRFFGAETPKTFNKTFGNLQDYLRFFQNRGPDIREFVTLFHDIEAANNVDLLNDIVQPCLLECLQNEAEKLLVIDRKQLYEKQLFLLFKKPVTSIKQFYACVLRAYTMEGFVYRNLNRYLRNEEWDQLDSLLPYAYCLCKAFLRSEFTTNLNNQERESLIVYRGAQFDEMTLSFYDPNTVKNFCWNGVTSTSRIRHVAEDFMYYNFDPKKIPVLFIIEIPLSFEGSNKWIDIKPYSAIPSEEEIVLSPGSVFELIKISKDNHKNTVEISLKLLINVKKLAHQGQIMHGAMHSEMANDTSFKLACLEGRELSDAIAHLEGNRLIEKLEFCLCKFDDKVAAVPLEKIPKLKNIKFISSFAGNETHWSVIFKHLEKTKIEKLKIFDNNFNNELLHILSRGIHSFVLLKSLTLAFTKSFKNIYNDPCQITDEGLHHLSSQGLKYLTSLSSLTLNFGLCTEITHEGLEFLSAQGLKYLTSLTSLTLNFEWCFKIGAEGLESLSSQGLKYLTSLSHLSLDFSWCSNIGDEGLNHLSSQGLKYLTSLTSLTLHFEGSSQITDEGLKNLSSQGLKNLTSLTSLTLKFPSCQISDEGLKNLSSQGLKNLTSLTFLTLNFERCGITDKGLKYLSLEGLKYLTSLSSLALNFKECYQITDEGLHQLGSQGLRYLTLLSSLNVNFDVCFEITDQMKRSLEKFSKLENPASPEGYQSVRHISFIRNLKKHFDLKDKLLSEGTTPVNTITLNLTYGFHGFTENILGQNGQNALTTCQSLRMKGLEKSLIEAISCLIKESAPHALSIKYLSLKFSDVEDGGLNNLSSQGLKYFTFLSSLTLNFKNCSKITDEGLKNLSSQGLKYLTSLSSLDLNFKNCEQITDKGLENLSAQGLKYLSSLKSLTLNFKACSRITDDGLSRLSSKGIKFLTSLTSLTLNWRKCNKITDKGLKNLSLEGLKYLISLTSLTLNFKECCPRAGEGALSQITGEGLGHLSSEGLKYLTSLSSLNLNFGFCTEITDEGLNHLSSQGLRYLTSLTSLNLKFEWCFQITDEGFGNLSTQRLRHLTSLTSLTLDFQNCAKITDEGLNQLSSQGLKFLTSLTSLKLNFDECKEIHPDAWSNFCKVLKYFGYETSQ